MFPKNHKSNRHFAEKFSAIGEAHPGVYSIAQKFNTVSKLQIFKVSQINKGLRGRTGFMFVADVTYIVSPPSELFLIKI